MPVAVDHGHVVVLKLQCCKAASDPALSARPYRNGIEQQGPRLVIHSITPKPRKSNL